MATKDENINEEAGGRRTRSGRKTSSTPTTPARSTRRSNRKQNQEANESESDIPDDNLKVIHEDDQYDPTQSDIIREMLAEAAQGVIIQDNQEYITTQDNDEQITEEIICATYEDPQEYHFETVTILDDDHEQFTEEIATIEGEEEDVEMVVIQNVDNMENVDDEPQDQNQQQTILTNTVVTSEMMQPIEQMVEDENGSSFPFGGSVQQSENSADNKIEENIGQQTTQMVESSLLASMAGDNANSLPSAGEESQSKENFDNVTVENIEEAQVKSNENEYNPDDTHSENAIAEDLPNGSDGNVTGPDDNDKTLNNVDAEMVSEDELQTPPPTTKPKVNDAEEVSDEELPGPKLAELPADTEVVSEDELPANGSKKDGSKRKAAADEEYNPSSPTGEESNDAAPEKKVKLETVEEKEEIKEKKKEKKKLPDLDKYWKTVKDDPSDFTGWTYLLQYVDQETDVEAAREAYDAFLFHYPYCYGYWRKYADYEKRKGDKEKCYEVFERGLKSIPLSVDLWIHYLSHVKSNSGDNEDYVRSQFNRAVEACGLEFRSDKLWEAFIKWEMESKRYSQIVKIYDKLLGIPTQGYNGHFDSFQDLISNHPPTVTISIEEFKKLRSEVRESNEKSTKSKEKHGKDKESKDKHSRDKDSKDKDSKDKDTKDKDSKDKDSKEKDSKDKDSKDKEPKDKDTFEKDKESKDESKSDDTDTTGHLPSDTSIVDKDEADDHVRNDDEMSAIKDKIISIRRKIHKTTVAAVTARWSFEEGIKRPYFHVKPLERSQLKNWKEYLDFEIEKGDRKRILILFERCLIACALYDEFWLKLIRYLECENDTKLTDYTRDAYIRSCTIHHPDKPSLHLMWSAFEECQNNFDKASDILIKLDERCPNLLQIAYRRINLERRRGNLVKCKELYEHYIGIAKSKNVAGSLAIKYARFCHKILKDIQLGMDKLKLTLEKDTGNTRVALQMIDLALQRDIVDENEIVEIMDKFVSRDGVDLDQKVLFAQRKVEFLEDFGSSAKALQEAQRYLQIALSKANEAKKKGESSPSHKSSKDSKLTTATASATANYNSTSGYYGGTTAATSQTSYYNNSGQQQQQQQYQQQSYDSYGYNHWQYGSGYSGYGQWSGYGNYY